MRLLRLRDVPVSVLAALLLVGVLACVDVYAAPQQPRYPGMDESVNKTLAEEAGVPARDPYIDVESMGELWNLMLLGAGGICGFIVGRHWDHMFGRRTKASST